MGMFWDVLASIQQHSQFTNVAQYVVLTFLAWYRHGNKICSTHSLHTYTQISFKTQYGYNLSTFSFCSSKNIVAETLLDWNEFFNLHFLWSFSEKKMKKASWGNWSNIVSDSMIGHYWFCNRLVFLYILGAQTFTEKLPSLIMSSNVLNHR